MRVREHLRVAPKGDKIRETYFKWFGSNHEPTTASVRKSSFMHVDGPSTKKRVCRKGHDRSNKNRPEEVKPIREFGSRQNGMVLLSDER